jgi:integrase
MECEDLMAIRKRQWTAPDGTAKQAWLVDYRDQSGKRRAKQFAKKKDAEAWSINAAAEVQQGIHTADSASVTVERAADLWLKSVRAVKDPPREQTTIAAYEQHVRLHIFPMCGATRLSQLTAPGVKALLDEWMLHLSRPMAVRVLRSFRAILTNAQASGLVAQNVALAVKIAKQSRPKAKIVPPPKADLRAILEAAQASDDGKARALVELVIFTGMRASELRGLAWSAVDLKRGTVSIEQRADAKGIVGPPKSKAGFRTIPLPPRVIKALTEWKLACPAHGLDLVFPSAKGRPLSHRVMTKDVVGPVQVAAGLKSPHRADMGLYGMHSFRHAAASLWIEQKLNAKRVQTLMGHGSIQVTFDTYGHLFKQADQDAKDALAIEAALFSDAT